MINLLPKSAKKNIVIEYWIRVITVWLLLFSLVSVLCLLFLLPTYVLVNSQVSVYRDSANEATQKIADFENVAADLVQASQQAKTIVDESDQSYLSDHIYIFESLQEPGIELSAIKISRTADNKIAPVTLDGIAVDRQRLADFRDRLLRQEMVEAVDFPISNLAKDRDISFSITVDLVNETQS